MLYYCTYIFITFLIVLLDRGPLRKVIGSFKFTVNCHLLKIKPLFCFASLLLQTSVFSYLRSTIKLSTFLLVGTLFVHCSFATHRLP